MLHFIVGVCLLTSCERSGTRNREGADARPAAIAGGADAADVGCRGRVLLDVDGQP